MLDNNVGIKVAVVGTVGLPANYGGFETLVENLVKYLGKQFQFTVYCSSKKGLERPKKISNVELVYIPLQANGIQSIPYDIISMFHAIFRADVLLVLGVSGCVCLPLVKMVFGKNIIVHIDGLEWKREKWGRMAKWFLKKSERIAIQYADKIIADNVAIQEYITKEYHKESVLIAYGGDHVLPVKKDQDLAWEYPFTCNNYAFKVCRIEPENNVHMVLEAFSKNNRIPLVIVGNWGNSEYGLALRKKFYNNKNIYLLDPIYDQSKLYQLRSSAKLYVHGHSAGGTNPSLVEAMFLGLPIISFDINYNRETTQNNAIYFSSVDTLEKVLTSLELFNLSILGSKMNALALKYYTWNIITKKYAKLFESPKD